MSNQTITELTEECNRLRNLADKAALVEAILENTSAPVFSLDRNYCYKYYNRAHASTMRSLYGSDIQIGKCLFDTQKVEEDRIGAKSALDRALAGEQVVVSAYSGDQALERRYFEIAHNPIRDDSGMVTGVSVVVLDMTERKRLADRNAELVAELKAALVEIKTLKGILPICAGCKKIRDEKGYWTQVESYLSDHTEAQCSHGLCPDCLRELYPDDAEATIEKLNSPDRD